MSRIPSNINIKNPLALAKVVAAKEQGIGRNLSESAENLILRGAEVSLSNLGDPSPDSQASESAAPVAGTDSRATDASREASAA